MAGFYRGDRQRVYVESTETSRAVLMEKLTARNPTGPTALESVVLWAETLYLHISASSYVYFVN